MAQRSGERKVMKNCIDDWHLSWEQLVDKYGGEEADSQYRYYRTCPTCGQRSDPGD